MRRYPLPPPSMWPYDRPLVHVLNGFYPAADLRRMSVPGLERLVSKLVQRTAKPTSKPQWWPSDLVFKHPIDLGLNSEREIKLAFKQLIVSCCQFFKANETRRRRVATKNEFLHHFKLAPKKGGKVVEVKKTAAVTATPKLACCTNIPFSSDVGRILAAKEHHGLSEEVKMKRLERSEWYINKELPRLADCDYEIAPYREPPYSHHFKFPKRQFHQQRRSLHDPEFLARFCTPVKVVLNRLDLTKIRKPKRKELVVLIKNSERMSCDFKADVKTVRRSQKLKQV